MEIVTLDLSFQGVRETVAAYLVKASEGAFLIETGPASTLPTLLDRITESGVQPSDIRHVLVTHIHLDHAGAAGWWSRQGAEIHVHHVGAPHLIDPKRLLISAARIYGDQMDSLWGETLPAQANKVSPLEDGERIKVCGLEIEALDTPGHARHHMVFRIGDIAFSGDAAGLKLPNVPLVDFPAPPPEFNREEWKATIDRLEAMNFKVIYPTHFGAIQQPDQHWPQLRDILEDAIYFLDRRKSQGVSRDELVEEYRSWNAERARRAGLAESQVRQYETANPLDMSVDGILRYLHKREQAKAKS